jgi:hypothetical protein
VIICRTKSNPKRLPKFQRLEMLIGVGREITPPSIILSRGWVLRPTPQGRALKLSGGRWGWSLAIIHRLRVFEIKVHVVKQPPNLKWEISPPPKRFPKWKFGIIYL